MIFGMLCSDASGGEISHCTFCMFHCINPTIPLIGLFLISFLTRSSIGQRYPRRRSLWCYLLCLLFSIAAAGLIVSVHFSIFINHIYVCMYVLYVFFLYFIL